MKPLKPLKLPRTNGSTLYAFPIVRILFRSLCMYAGDTGRIE